MVRPVHLQPQAQRASKDDPAPRGPGLLTSLAIAAGVVALGMYVFDWHSHSCEACGHKWRHLGALNVGDPRAHTCARCGTVQWWKDGVPHVFRSALLSPPPSTEFATISENGHHARRELLAIKESDK
jgi:hypothetical protein